MWQISLDLGRSVGCSDVVSSFILQLLAGQQDDGGGMTPAGVVVAVVTVSREGGSVLSGRSSAIFLR